MSTPNYTDWRQLGRPDLTTFDDTMTGIVMEYMDLGWLGKMSKKGHAILRAPDGKDTTSVSRSGGRGGSGTRARADLERWKANRPGRAFGVPLVPEREMFDDLDDYERYGVVMRDPKLRDHLRMMRDLGHTPETAHERLMVNTSSNSSEKENWYAIDPMTRKAVAWGKDLTEERVYEVHYGTNTLEKTKPETESLPYVCDECGLEFDSGRSLGGHVNGHKPLVRCEVCGWEGKYIIAHMDRKHPQWVALSDASKDEVKDLLDSGELHPAALTSSKVKDAIIAAHGVGGGNPTEKSLDWSNPIATVVDPDPLEALMADEPKTEPLATVDPLDAVQALIDEVRAGRSRHEDFLAASEEITRLRAELAEVTKDRDHYKAKVEVLREALDL